jgi:hypothetical protein
MNGIAHKKPTGDIGQYTHLAKLTDNASNGFNAAVSIGEVAGFVTVHFGGIWEGTSKDFIGVIEHRNTRSSIGIPTDDTLT